MAHRLRRVGYLLAVSLCVPLVVSATASTAWADSTGSIDHVEVEQGELHLLYSLPGLADNAGPELASLKASINDEPVTAEASLAEDATATNSVARTAILAIDVSDSMRGARFTEAKAAARAFIDAAPADVLIGVVAFAAQVTAVQQPTSDRSALTRVIGDLSLSRETRLNDGVIEAVAAVGDKGQRSLLVLSDGKDTSSTPIGDVTEAIREAKVQVDVVALEQSATARQPLEQMAAAGQGTLLTADEPRALVRLFSDEATTLAKQVLVTVEVPADLSGSEGNISVSIDAAGETFTDTAFVTLKRLATPAPAVQGPEEISPPASAVSNDMMLVGLGAGGLGVLMVLLVAMGVFKTEEKETLQDRVLAYSRTGDPRSITRAGGASAQPSPTAKNVTQSAVGLAEKALAANKGFESRLGAKLDAAGVSLKPAEWLLLHAGVAVGAAVLGFLFSSGGLLMTLLLLAGGVMAPWFYLKLKKARRLKAFNGHLGETLQLISGGLSAGLSLAQSLDTVVREGTEPIAGEFRRALIEARLGVQVEDALDSMAVRMESDDFGWVVMAIRIQRQVGGNLAELLLSVAATMRERDYLRRQVKSLSAEGRLSGLILGGLPPGVLVFLMITNPTYLDPLFDNVVGWLMIAGMAVLMAVGSFWMSRVVKVEV